MADFEWPKHNIFDHTGEQRNLYNEQVREYVRSYIKVVPAILDVYNEYDNQRYIFADNEEPVKTKNRVYLKTYNLPLPYYDNGVAKIIIQNLRPLLTNASRVNASAGFIHTTSTPDKYSYKYPGVNTQLCQESLTVLKDGDLTELEKCLEHRRVFERIDMNFTKTYRFQIVGIMNIQLQVWHAEYKIGCKKSLLQQHLTLFQKKCAWTFSHSPDDGKCFFRALAAHFLCRDEKKKKYRDAVANGRLQKLTNDLWLKAYMRGLCKSPPNDAFVDLNNTDVLEELFEIHIRWYSMDNSLPVIKYTNKSFSETVHLVLSNEHCVLITDVHLFFEEYFCKDCKKIYANKHSIFRHKVSCKPVGSEAKEWKFIGGPERPIINPFDQLSAYNIVIDKELKFKHAFVAFDIESMLQQPAPNFFNAKQLRMIVSEHVPISIAAAYSADAASVENPECFISNRDPAALVEEFVQYLLRIHEQQGNITRERYKPLFTALDERIATIEQYVPLRQRKQCKFLPLDASNDGQLTQKNRFLRALKQLYKIRDHFEQLAFRVTVLGYNSSSYDINAMRAWLIPCLTKYCKDLNAVKRRSRYLVLSTDKFNFMDMYLFLAANTSLRNFIPAYTTAAELANCRFSEKLEFPYEYLSNYDVLDETELPPAEHWTESKQKYDAEQDVQIKEKLLTAAQERRLKAQTVWETSGCITFRDYLILYNKADVSPFIKAVQTYANLYKNKGFDIFQFSTLPSLAKQCALASCPKGAWFERFPKYDAPLYDQIRSSMPGGAAIVWTRMAEAGKTKIRPYEFKQRAQLVDTVVGVDMTACYLWATCQELPTGPYFVRRAESNFAIENNITDIYSVLAIEYLVSKLYGSAALERLTHRYRGGETQIITADCHVYSVDGHLVTDNGDVIIIEYNGCYWHNHTTGCTMPHSVNSKYDKDIQDQRIDDLQRHAAEVHVIHECDWHKQMQAPEVLSFLRTRPLFKTWQTRLGIPDNEIIPKIMNGDLKGIFEIDAYVPKTHRHLFTDLNPFYYQFDIKFDMIGATMRKLMTDAKREFVSHRMLVNAPFCKNLLLPHQYIQWLVKHGIVIHKIHKIIEFPMCSSPFYEVGEQICRDRQNATRKGATELEKAINEVVKLFGNTIYGQFITQPENFSVTLFVDSGKLKKILFKRKIRAISALWDDLFEVTMSKETVSVKQCPQMGLFVYALSKMRMLEFGYEWLSIMARPLSCLILTDTDSYYVALARKTWEECVRADVSAEKLDKFKHEFFVTDPARSKYRGLFHIEFSGSLIIALQPKLYFARGDTSEKLSARGVDKRENTLDVDMFRKLLLEPPDLNAAKLIQKSFRVVDNSVVTYRLFMSNINSFYYKRSVLPNLIDTESLDYTWPPEFNQ